MNPIPKDMSLQDTMMQGNNINSSKELYSPIEIQ
jgi:hypothetical protein